MVRVKKNRTRSFVQEATGERVRGRNAILLGIAFSLPLLRGITKPFWISIPSIGEVNQWWPLNHIAVLYPLCAAVLLFINARTNPADRVITGKKLLFSIRLLLLLFIASFVFFAVRLYIIWFDNPVGKYLLWSPNGYYFIKLWEFGRPYVLHVGMGLALGAFFLLLYAATRGRAVEKNEALLGALVGMIFGPVSAVWVVLTALALTALWFIVRSLQHVPTERLSITPGLLLASYIFLLVKP